MKTGVSVKAFKSIFIKYQHVKDIIEKNIFVCGVLLVLVAGCQSGESCKKVLNEKCIRCHSISTSCAKVGESEERWLKLLDAMAKLGADVSKKEQKTLARCLGRPSGSGVEEVCR